MKKTAFRHALWICALIFLGCDKTVDIMGEHKSNYHKILKSVSKEARFYGLERVPYMTNVVYKSEPLERAYVLEYSQKYRFNEDEYKRMLEKVLTQIKDHETFIIFHFANNDQSPKESSLNAWKLRLQFIGSDSTSRGDPETVTLLPADDHSQYFYPQTSPWSKNYLVRFKKPNHAYEKIKLTMDSVSANLSFEWKK